MLCFYEQFYDSIQSFSLLTFGQNLANFVSLTLKIDNPYYHIVEKWKLEGKLDNRKAVRKHFLKDLDQSFVAKTSTLIK